MREHAVMETKVSSFLTRPRNPRAVYDTTYTPAFLSIRLRYANLGH